MSKKRIILFEDNLSYQIAFENILKRIFGDELEIFIFNSLQEFKRSSIEISEGDIFLVDHNLTSSKGVDVVRTLRERLPSIQLIFGISSDQDVQSSYINEGFYIGKPQDLSTGIEEIFSEKGIIGDTLQFH